MASNNQDRMESFKCLTKAKGNMETYLDQRHSSPILDQLINSPSNSTEDELISTNSKTFYT